MKNKFFHFSLRQSIMELFDIGPIVAISVLTSMVLIFIFGIVFFIRSAPPSEISIASGPEGSMFHRTAVRYQKALEKSGVKVNIISTHGSLDNLERINTPQSKVDLALIQNGIIEENYDVSRLVSLGAIANMPVFFFYRGNTIDQLVDIKGKTIAIGQKGSGTNKIALQLLALNGIKPEGDDKTTLLELEPESAALALHHKTIDGAFMMSENVAIDDLRKLMRSEHVHLMNFKRNASAYIRKMDNLNMLDLPEGVLDFGQNIPKTDISLVGPMVELIATEDFHPALSDLVLDAAFTVHSHAGLFQKRTEFPLARSHSIKLSDDASRFYTSGKTLLYRHLPFWLASLLSRILVVFIPMLVVMFPIIRSVPLLIRWKNLLRFRRLYRALMQLEEKFKNETDPEKIAELQKNFARIDHRINNMRVRPAFAEQFYHLRGHIDYVRRLMARTPKTQDT